MAVNSGCNFDHRERRSATSDHGVAIEGFQMTLPGRYIRLSEWPDAGDINAATVFVMLGEYEYLPNSDPMNPPPPNQGKYAWSLLFKKGNAILEYLLTTLGFEPEVFNNSAELPTLDEWIVFTDPETGGPFELFDQAEAPEEQLTTYLRWDSLAPPGVERFVAPVNPAPTGTDMHPRESLWILAHGESHPFLRYGQSGIDFRFFDSNQNALSPTVEWAFHAEAFVAGKRLPLDGLDVKLQVRGWGRPAQLQSPFSNVWMTIDQSSLELLPGQYTFAAATNGNASCSLHRDLASWPDPQDPKPLHFPLLADATEVLVQNPAKLSLLVTHRGAQRVPELTITGAPTAQDSATMQLKVFNKLVYDFDSSKRRAGRSGRSLADPLSILIPSKHPDPTNTADIKPLGFAIDLSWTQATLGNNTDILSLPPDESPEWIQDPLASGITPDPDSLEQLAANLPGFDTGLSELVGDFLPGNLASLGRMNVEDLSDIDDTIAERIRQEYVQPLTAEKITLPLVFAFNLDDQTIKVVAAVSMNLRSMRVDQEAPFFLLFDQKSGTGEQMLDLTAFAIKTPARATPESNGNLQIPDERNRDGLINLETQELIFDFRGAEDVQGGVEIFVPGDFQTSAADPVQRDRHLRERSERFSLQLRAFDPETWPEAGDNPLFLKIGPRGACFHGLLNTNKEVMIQDNERRSSRFSDIKFTPVAERDGQRSEVVVINNHLPKAKLFADILLPGLDDLVVEAGISLSKDKRDRPPTVTAALELRRSKGRPVTSLSIGYLDVTVDEVRMKVTWQDALMAGANASRWDFQAYLDGELALNEGISTIEPLANLEEAAMKVTNLNLLNLNERELEIRIALQKTFEFSIFDELIACRMHEMEFAWAPGTLVVKSKRAELKFKRQGQFTVGIEVGDLHLEFSGRSVSMRVPSRLGIEVKVGTTVDFRGELGWVDDHRGTFFEAEGHLQTQVIPRCSAVLKYGSEVKNNGRSEASLVIYANVELQSQPMLMSGVFLKSVGAGVGWNNRLRGLPMQPTAQQVIDNIDLLSPGDSEGWEFVKRDGLHVSIVANAMFASNRGSRNTSNAYVAWVLLTMNQRFDVVVAAVKTWLFSSVEFVENNWNRPAIVGALTLVPRIPMLNARLESRPNPAIESAPELEKIFNQGKLRMSFTLSPTLVDFHLEELSYRSEFLGVEMGFIGRYRVSVYAGRAFTHARLDVYGRYSNRLAGGRGGFEFSATLDMRAEYGGLLSSRGLIAFADVDASFAASASAWITIGFKKTIGCCGVKREIGWEETFRTGEVRLDLGLSGGFGFNESGTAGFSARVLFSRNIGSYNLTIDPQIEVRPEVIEAVKGRVLAFEERIKLAAPSERALAVKRTAAPRLPAPSPKEKWTAYFSTRQAKDNGPVRTYWLVVPQVEEKWFTPYFTPTADPDEHHTFAEHVTELEIRDGNGRTLDSIRPAWVADNWKDVSRTGPWPRDPRDPKHPDNALDHLFDSWRRLQRLFAALTETAEIQDRSPGPITSAAVDQFTPVYDKRVESLSRDAWNYEDQFLVPDYVLPFDFRPGTEPEDVQKAASRARLHRTHKADDADEAEQARAMRSAVVDMMLEDLRTADEGHRFLGPVAGLEPGNEGIRCIFSLDEGTEFETLFVKRGAGSFEEVEVTRVEVPRNTNNNNREAMTSVLDAVKLLPPRQKYVADEIAAPADGAEREDPVAEFRRIDADGDNHITLDEYVRGKAAASVERGRVLVKLPLNPVDLYKSNDKPGLDSVNYFEVWRRLPGEDLPRPLGKRIQLQHIFLKDDPGNLQVFVPPYIFTDEFEVRDRQLTKAGLVAGESEVFYFLRAVPFSEPTDHDPLDPGADDPLAAWPPVRLYVPPQRRFPTSLGIVFPNAGEVAIDSATCQLIHTEGEDPKPTDPRLSPDDFEIWLEELPLRQSGFYGDGDGAAGVPVAEEAASSLQSRVSTPGSAEVDRFFPLSGKTQIVAITQPADTRNNTTLRMGMNGQVRPGFGYRFFIRPKAAGAEGLLTPLPVYLTREELPEIGPADQIRSVDALEIPSAAPDSEEAWLRSHEFAASGALSGGTDISEAGNDVRVSWRVPARLSGGEPLGGAEIVIQDLDEPNIVLRQYCEIQEDRIFRINERDFSDAGAWLLATKREEELRTAGRTSIVSSRDSNPFVPYFWDDNAPVFRKLRNELVPAGTTLGKHLEHFEQSTGSENWKLLMGAALNWMRLVAEFLAGSHNDSNRKLLTGPDGLAEMSDGFRLMMLGLAHDGKKPAERMVEFNQQRNKMQAAEINDPRFQHSDQASQDHGLDVVLAKRTLGVLELRRALAESILSNDHNALALGGESSGLPSRAVIRDVIQQYHAYRARPGNEQAQLPLTKWVCGNLADDGATIAGELREMLNNYVALAAAPRPDEKEDRARTIVQARGLAAVLRALRDEVGETSNGEVQPNPQTVLIERPHRQLDTSRGEGDDADKKSPVHDALSDLIPRLTDEEEASTPQLGSAFVAFMNFLERIGVAVDVAIKTPRFGAMEQEKIISAVRQADVIGQVPVGHHLMIVTGVEPDSRHQREDTIGHSFVKIAVIPEQLLSDLDAAGVSAMNWLDLRSIDVATIIRNNQRVPDPDDDAVRDMRRLAGYLRKWLPQLKNDSVTPVVINVEPRSNHWVTIPEVSGRAHAVIRWPDRRGHRLHVAVRLVDRYELLRQWRDDEVVEPTLPANPQRLRRVELIPIIPAAADDDEFPGEVTVLTYPHAELIRFSYHIPDVGARSVYNKVSLVRSGYRGAQLSFAYRYLRMTPTLANILGGFEHEADERISAPHVETVFRAVSPNPTAFRHERYVTLRNMPYCYEYQLAARTLYDAHGQPDLSNEEAVEFVRRLPGSIAIQNGSTIDGAANSSRRTVRIWLTDYKSQLTQLEVDSGPPDLDAPRNLPTRTGRVITPKIRQLPDLGMRYRLLYWAAGSEHDKLFIPILEVLLPWSPGYEENDKQDAHDPSKPFARRLPGNIRLLGNPNDEAKLWPQIVYHHHADSDSFAYYVEITFEPTDDADMQPGYPHLTQAPGVPRFYLQAGRDGIFTSERPLRIV